MDRCAISSLIDKGQSKRSHRDGSIYAPASKIPKAKPSGSYTFTILFIFLVLGIYLTTCPEKIPDLHFISSPFLEDMVSPAYLPAWVATSLTLLSSAVARMTWHEATTPDIRAEDATNHGSWTVSAIQTLQTWYDEGEGLWNSTGWWNSANCLTALGDFYAVDAASAEHLDLDDVFSNTFSQAQKPSTPSAVVKTFTVKSNGLRIVESHYTTANETTTSRREFPGFINDYYDDEGWWALAWIRAFDVTGKSAYLSVAESIFADMRGGVNSTCSGGIWWNKDRTYKNAIANELYLSVAASLANRVPGSSRAMYLDIGKTQWAWFRGSGMINDNNLVNDGLDIYANGTCVNNGETTWTYNQGVVLGGLVELYKATGNSSLLDEAVAIAEAAINALSVGGILHEPCEDDCGADGSQFKGMISCPSHKHHGVD